MLFTENFIYKSIIKYYFDKLDLRLVFFIKMIQKFISGKVLKMTPNHYKKKYDRVNWRNLDKIYFL